MTRADRKTPEPGGLPEPAGLPCPLSAVRPNRHTVDSTRARNTCRLNICCKRRGSINSHTNKLKVLPNKSRDWKRREKTFPAQVLIKCPGYLSRVTTLEHNQLADASATPDTRPGLSQPGRSCLSHLSCANQIYFQTKAKQMKCTIDKIFAIVQSPSHVTPGAPYELRVMSICQTAPG